MVFSPDPVNYTVMFNKFVDKVVYYVLFSPTAKLAMGSLAQNSSGAIRCSCNTRFRTRFRRVPEMRFERVPAQMADEVPGSFGADS